MSLPDNKPVVPGRCCANCEHGEKKLQSKPCCHCNGEDKWEIREDLKTRMEEW